MMADFGVRCPADFVTRLLVQGAWSRCSRCTSAIRAERVQSRNRERQAEAATLTHVCRTCAENLPKGHFWPADWRSNRARGISCKTCLAPQPNRGAAAPLASAAVHNCATCSQERRRCEYWPADWDHRHQSISCRGCQPLEPGLRASGQRCIREGMRQHSEALREKAAARTFVCADCKQELVRGAYWPGDVINRFQNPLRCKTCRPTPPSERRKQKATASGAHVAP